MAATMANQPGWQFAQTASAANEVASQAVQDAINNLGLPAQHRAWIAKQWAALPPNQNLHRNCQPTGSSGWGTQGPVVQVDTAFTKSGGGTGYHVAVMLDVDDPPQVSGAQPPHFGWEVYFNKGRFANGHVELPMGVLSFGRTFKGKGLEIYGYKGGEEEVAGKPDGVEVETSFKRYK